MQTPRVILATSVILMCVVACAALGDHHQLDAGAISEAAGAEASATDDGVVRIGWARDDVPVTVDGVKFPPAAGLGSWAAFMPTAHGATVMGDTVVFQDEVSPAMDAAFAHGLEVTALHNHFFFDEPRVYFMHIGGHGDPQELAAGVKAVWDAIQQVRERSSEPATRFGDGPIPQPGKGLIDPQPIERLTGLEPSVNPGGVVKVTIGRESAMHGVKFGGPMGLTTWAAFSGSDELAAIDGDFAMTAEEVQPVLRAMRKAGLHVVALHNHMVGETPAYYFVHFWATGPAEELAKSFKSVLDAQAIAAPPPEKQAVVFDFEKDETGRKPAGFSEALAGGGGAVEWRVQEVDDAPSGRQVVAQLSDDRTNARYPQLVRDDFIAKDIDLSVRFKTISGDVDASGGLVFRYKDKDNFYVVRANSLEGNVVAYKTENGRRSNIGVKGEGNAYGVKADVPHQQWNALRVIMEGNLIEVFLNDRKLFEVENDTFTEAGKVGLWTKADAVTQFDELLVTSLD